MVLPMIDSSLIPVDEFLKKPGEIIVRKNSGDKLFALNYSTKISFDGKTPDPNFDLMMSEMDSLYAVGATEGINPLVRVYNDVPGYLAILREIMPEYTLTRLGNLEEDQRKSLGKIVRELHQKGITNLGLRGK